jgi:cytochrome P450
MNPPRYIIILLPESARSIFEFLHQIESQIDEILANLGVLERNSQRETIFSHILADGGQQGVLSREELLQEAHALLLAGSDTVGHTCYTGFFHVLNDRDILQHLVDEIYHAWPDKETEIASSILEKLPYLVIFSF